LEFSFPLFTYFLKINSDREGMRSTRIEVQEMIIPIDSSTDKYPSTDYLVGWHMHCMNSIGTTVVAIPREKRTHVSCRSIPISFKRRSASRTNNIFLKEQKADTSWISKRDLQHPIT
jgi:hypothetical protein